MFDAHLTTSKVTRWDMPTARKWTILIMTENRDLTPKEQQVIDEFDRARPGLGEMVERDIRNSNSGYAEIIKDTPDEELVLKVDVKRR